MFTLGMIGFVAVAMGAVVVATVIFKFMGAVTSIDQLLTLVRRPLLLVVLCALLAMIYRYGLSRRQAPAPVS